MIKIIKKEEIVTPKRYLGLIYGQPATGKTTIGCSAVKPLFIDTDGGMHRVRSKYRADSLSFSKYADILELFNEKEVLLQYETIVFDTFGSLLTLLEEHVVGLNPANKQSNGELSMKGYGVRKKEFMRLLERIVDSDKSALFLAHEKEERDGEERLIKILATGSSINDLMFCLDFVGYLSMKGSKRIINFNPTSQYYAKNSLELPENIEVPGIEEKNTFIQDYIVRFLEEKILAEKDFFSQAEKVEKLLNSKKEFNEKVSDVKSLNLIGQAKAEALFLIKKRAEKEGYEYDAEAKKFVKPEEKVLEQLSDK